jgi:formylglycine-generating enzyme required for sulfatase activity
MSAPEDWPVAHDDGSTIPPTSADLLSDAAAPTLPPGDPQEILETILPTLPPGSSNDAGTLTAAVSRSARGLVPGYEILGELGRGGMGVVYKARQTRLGRLVALKMILAGAHASRDDLARFQTEGEAVARLQHPNIVQVHEVGEHDGRPFFSLEFCPGGSLDKKLAGTPLPPKDAAGLVEKLALAMQAAHARNVLHRDLKPANVLLGAGGEPKITDFGLAKKLDEQGRTATGAVMGTPSYMAPEQARGESKAVGPAADVYALGAILYECLTGRPPFRAATPLDTVWQVLSEDPVAVTRLNVHAPRDLETVCHKCLHKDPAKRYATAAALAEELGRFQRGEPIMARPVGWVERGWRWCRRNPVVAGLVAAVALVTVLGVAGIVWHFLDAEHQMGIAEERRKDAEQQKGIALAQKQVAEKEAAKAKAVRDFVVNIFQFADPNSKRGTINAREILDEADKRIRRDFAEQPELQEELLTAMEEVYAKIGLIAPAAMILEARGAVQLHVARGGNQPAVPQRLLVPGDRLHLGADAEVQLLVLSDLHKEWLKAAREVTLRRKGCEPPEAVHERADNILMTFVRLPKGTFYMGGDYSQRGVEREIKEDFEIAVHDVTQGQWQAVMGNNPSSFSRFGKSRDKVADISDEELKLFPVETVSWDDAQKFIKKLNEKEQGRGYLYRLLTEAEWEYACRGGATSVEECWYNFYFAKPTNDLSSEQANFNGNFPSGEAPKGNYLQRPTRVGAYPPNKLGLCDMHGNVAQWCADMYGRDGSDRVLRGGCWNDFGSGCQAGYRNRFAPTGRVGSLGFRLARVPVR